MRIWCFSLAQGRFEGSVTQSIPNLGMGVFPMGQVCHSGGLCWGRQERSSGPSVAVPHSKSPTGLFNSGLTMKDFQSSHTDLHSSPLRKSPSSSVGTFISVLSYILSSIETLMITGVGGELCHRVHPGVM